MLQKIGLLFLFVVGAMHGMESIAVAPLSSAEVRAMAIGSFLKEIDPEDQDDWKKISAKQDSTQITVDILCDAMSQRLAITEVPVLNELYNKFHAHFVQQTMILSCDDPVPLWPAVKKAFTLFEVLGARSNDDKEILEYRKVCMLRYALWQDDCAFADFVIKRGISPNYILEHRPVFHEARSGAMMELLERSGAKLPSPLITEGHTLLHKACSRQKKADLVTFLLAKGFVVDPVDNNRCTPLATLAHTAFYEPSERVEPRVIALLKAGANRNFTVEGKTLSEIALKYKEPGKVGDGYFPESVDRFVALLKDAAEEKDVVEQKE
jgi:hypothetical protein